MVDSILLTYTQVHSFFDVSLSGCATIPQVASSRTFPGEPWQHAFSAIKTLVTSCLDLTDLTHFQDDFGISSQLTRM